MFEYIYRNWFRRDRVLLYLACVGLALHLLSLVFVVVRGFDFSPIQDPLEHRLIAEHLLQGFGFSIWPGVPDLLRGPLYPLVLAASLGTTGSVVPIIALQQIAISATALLVAVWIVQCGFSTLAARFAAAYIMLEPTSWFWSLHTMTETVSMFLLALYGALSCGLLAQEKWRPFLLGATGGALLLVKPSLMLAVLVGLVCCTYVSKSKLNVFAIALASLLLVVSPWIIRNYMLTNSFVLSSSFAVNTVLGFGTPAEKESMKEGPSMYDAHGRMGYAMTAFTAHRYGEIHGIAQEALHRTGLVHALVVQVRAAPALWFEHSYDAILLMARVPLSGMGKSVLGTLDMGISVLILFLLLAGILVGIRRAPVPTLLALLSIVSVMVPNLTISYARMLIPVLPLIALIVAFGLDGIVAFVGRVRSGV